MTPDLPPVLPSLPVDDPGALDAAITVLVQARACVIPTDTVYGLASLPEHQDVLRQLKGRPDQVPIAVLVTDVDQFAVAIGQPPPQLAADLAERFWPGPLTIVVATAAGPTLGVRCPDTAFARRLAEQVGPLATTSANRHGEPTPVSAMAAALALVHPPAYVIDGGDLRGTASTVVDATGPAPVVLRAGPITEADLGGRS